MTPDKILKIKMITMLILINTITILIFGEPAEYSIIIGYTMVGIQYLSFKFEIKELYIFTILLTPVILILMFMEYGLIMAPYLVTTLALTKVGTELLRKDMEKVTIYMFKKGLSK